MYLHIAAIDRIYSTGCPECKGQVTLSFSKTNVFYQIMHRESGWYSTEIVYIKLCFMNKQTTFQSTLESFK